MNKRDLTITIIVLAIVAIFLIFSRNPALSPKESESSGEANKFVKSLERNYDSKEGDINELSDFFREDTVQDSQNSITQDCYLNDESEEVCQINNREEVIIINYQKDYIVTIVK